MQALLAFAAIIGASCAPVAEAAHGRRLNTFWGKQLLINNVWGFSSKYRCGGLNNKCCWPTRWNPDGCVRGLTCSGSDWKICVKPEPVCGKEWQACCAASKFGDGCNGDLVCGDSGTHTLLWQTCLHIAKFGDGRESDLVCGESDTCVIIMQSWSSHILLRMLGNGCMRHHQARDVPACCLRPFAVTRPTMRSGMAVSRPLPRTPAAMALACAHDKVLV